MKRSVFFLSDHTGITAEAMGRSLLSQFQDLTFDITQWPFLDSIDKVRHAVKQINQLSAESPVPPLIFSTLVDPKLRDCLKQANGLIFDYFDAFIPSMEKEFNMTSSHIHGQVHSMANNNAYEDRIHAINFAMTNDDGAITKNYVAADLILIGVSRSGKTPTCLYMGLQYGILAANYPLTEDDLDKTSLPNALQSCKDKLYGLTINLHQLQRIRKQRRANGRYASREQCQWEINQAEQLYEQNNIPMIDTTAMSIEEIAAKIIATTR